MAYSGYNGTILCIVLTSTSDQFVLDNFKFLLLLAGRDQQPVSL